MTPEHSEPVAAWHWDIRTGHLTTYECLWPGGISSGDRSEALDAWGFQLEFTATPESHELGPQVAVYSRFLPEDDTAMPFHYCIVLAMSTFYELVFAADLPELVDALRYLAPLIKI